MIKKLLGLLIALLSFAFSGNSQHFEWISHHPSLYSFNPDMLESPMTIFPQGGEVNARLDSFALHFGQDAFGKIIIERRTSLGNLVWNFILYNKVFVKRMVADENGNTYIGGGFMDTLSCNGPAEELINTGSGFNVNFFLIKLGPNGNLIWKRNLALTRPETSFEAVNVDPDGNFWYSMNDFNNSSLFKVDSIGDDADSLRQEGSLILSSFDFDFLGNLFITGATSNGTLTFGNQSYIVPETYMMFLGRYDVNRNASWAYFGHDITFQHPKIVSDKFGNAYFGCTLFDSTTFGTLHFPAPQWTMDFFLLKIDSAGTFQWGKSNPANLSPITGRFLPDGTEFLDTDSAGNIYMGGNSAGILDWDNGIVLTAGTGQLWENRLSVVSFDGNGNSRWGKIFGSATYNSMHSLKTSAEGECYFNVGLRDTAQFDTLIFPGNGDMNFVIGKISTQTGTGIIELENNSHSIYPVPSTGLIHFQGPDMDVEIRIYDLSGKLIRSERHNSISAYNAESIRDGFFIIQLINSRGIENFRWMKSSN